MMPDEVSRPDGPDSEKSRPEAVVQENLEGTGYGESEGGHGWMVLEGDGGGRPITAEGGGGGPAKGTLEMADVHGKD